MADACMDTDQAKYKHENRSQWLITMDEWISDWMQVVSSVVHECGGSWVLR